MKGFHERVIPFDLGVFIKARKYYIKKDEKYLIISMGDISGDGKKQLRL